MKLSTHPFNRWVDAWLLQAEPFLQRMANSRAGRRLANARDALGWHLTLGPFRAPSYGRGSLLDKESPPASGPARPEHRQDTTPPASDQGGMARAPDKAKQRDAKQRGGTAGQGQRQPTELQRRLAEAITAGPPGGGTWNPTTLAKHIGCARSTASGALQRAAGERTRSQGRTKSPAGKTTRSRPSGSPSPACRRQRRRPDRQRERA